MLIDQFNVFFDSTVGAASANSPGVNVSPFAGRDEPINITVILTGAGVGTMAVKVQESNDNTTFTDAGTFGLEKAGPAGAVLTIALPRSVKKKFVRLAYTLAGPQGDQSWTPAGLKVFAAVTRDHFAPYAEGQFIDAGKVVA